MILSLQDFVVPKPDMPWQKDLLLKNISTMLLSLLGSVICLVLFFRFVFPRLSTVISGPYLSATLEGTHVASESSMGISVGVKGTVVKILRPTGSARFADRVYDVITEGEYIEKGEPVIITEIQGNRIVVIKDSGYDQ
jgi:membrane-bound serine protease (ClpP class)